MPDGNLELVRRGFDRFVSTGDFDERIIAPDFVWDMSTFGGWPERLEYHGIEGAREFMRDWVENWEEWTLEVQSLHERDDKVVAVLRQRGRSRTTGLEVDMTFGQVFTIRDGKQVRMEMYADPAEALAAAGIES